MIKRSFKFLEGINREFQRKLHSDGINDWDDFLKAETIEDIDVHLKKRLDKKIREYQNALDEKDYDYFACHLPPSSHWRLYDTMKKDRTLCFMDIETTGLQFFNDEVTLVGIYDGTYYQALVAGIDLDSESLEKALAPFKMIVTYNGMKFDIPFLKYQFPDLKLNKLMFDLSFPAKRHKLGNSLKELEKHFGMARNGDIAGLNGHHIVKMWDKFQAGDIKSLELLKEHNQSDTSNLNELADKVFEYLVGIDY